MIRIVLLVIAVAVVGGLAHMAGADRRQDGAPIDPGKYDWISGPKNRVGFHSSKG